MVSLKAQPASREAVSLLVNHVAGIKTKVLVFFIRGCLYDDAFCLLSVVEWTYIYGFRHCDASSFIVCDTSCTMVNRNMIHAIVNRELVVSFHYRTPLVLGISFPPVLSIACLIARARALNADSALKQQCDSNQQTTLRLSAMHAVLTDRW